MKSSVKKPKQKFQVGDVINDAHGEAYLVIYAGLSNIDATTGDKIEYYWAYSAVPIGWGDDVIDFNSNEEPSTCKRCREREFVYQNLELFKRTGIPRSKLQFLNRA